MSSPSLIYVLAEDQRQRQLLYRFLRKSGVRSHQMQFELSPSGQGSAEKWICDNFARQAGKCRVRNARASTGMIVMIDADRRSMKARLEALDQSLADADLLCFDPSRDPIARLVPKRNVETWILYLSTKGEINPEINEDQDYKQARSAEEWSNLIPPAAETLYEWTKDLPALPENLIDSLRRGMEEIPRALPKYR